MKNEYIALFKRKWFFWPLREKTKKEGKNEKSEAAYVPLIEF